MGVGCIWGWAAFDDFDKPSTSRKARIHIILAGSLAATGAVLLMGGYYPMRLKERIHEAQPLIGKGRTALTSLLGWSKRTEQRRGGKVIYETWSALWVSITLEFTDDVCTCIAQQSG
jgi:hypothetical protein